MFVSLPWNALLFIKSAKLRDGVYKHRHIRAVLAALISCGTEFAGSKVVYLRWYDLNSARTAGRM